MVQYLEFIQTRSFYLKHFSIWRISNQIKLKMIYDFVECDAFVVITCVLSGVH